MSGQIIHTSSHDAISEVALKCGDPFYKDFPKNIYSQAVYRAERSIAKEYGILDRILTITTEDDTGEFEIFKLNFLGEWRVTLTQAETEDDESETISTVALDLNKDGSVNLKKVNWDDLNKSTSSYEYAVNYFANRYMMKYNPASTGDTITIYYTSGIAGEEDFETYDQFGNTNLIPVLPNQFYEEVIRRACLYIAGLGIARFENEKAEKYQRIIRFYQRRSDLADDKTLYKDSPWIIIKPFSSRWP